MVTLRRNREILWLFLAGVIVIFTGCGNPFVRPEARDTLSLSLVLGSASEEGSRGIFTDSDFAGKTLRVVLFRNNDGSPGAEIARSNSVIQAKNGNLVAEVSFPNTPLNTSVILRGQIIDGGLVYFEGLSQPFVTSSTAVDLALNETVFNKLDYWFTFEDLNALENGSNVSHWGKSNNSFSVLQIPNIAGAITLSEADPLLGIIPKISNRFLKVAFGQRVAIKSQNVSYLNNSFTLVFWVWVVASDTTTNPVTLFQFLNSTGNSVGKITFDETNQGVIFNFQLGLTSNFIQSQELNPESELSEEWNMLAVTFNTDAFGTRLELFVNGQNLGETSNANPNSLSNEIITSFTLGFEGPNTNQGAFDDIRIYSEAMTAAQVLALYNATKPQ